MEECWYLSLNVVESMYFDTAFMFAKPCPPNTSRHKSIQLIPVTKELHILITSVFTYEIIEVVSVKK